MTLPRPRARLIIGLTLAWTVLAFLLPVALAVSATFFWGRGVIEKEGVLFAVNYLSDRPTISMIFDPRVNDFGTFQARELSYFVDCILKNETPMNDGPAGLRVVRLLEAAEQSLNQQGQIVYL